MYGIFSKAQGFIHTSNIERGAKSHATKSGYAEVYHCSEYSWSVSLVSSKVANKWVNV